MNELNEFLNLIAEGKKETEDNLLTTKNKLTQEPWIKNNERENIYEKITHLIDNLNGPNGNKKSPIKEIKSYVEFQKILQSEINSFNKKFDSRYLSRKY